MFLSRTAYHVIARFFITTAITVLSLATRVESESTPLGPLTPHFTKWLANTPPFVHYRFDRPDLGPTGSYGGRADETDEPVNQPVVFVHGNSDGALAIPGPYSTGWTSSISYFLSKGYKSSELYVTTWGDRNPYNAKYRTHSCEYLSYMRTFVDAVFAYTRAPKIDVISHSMGVTLARGVLNGGLHVDNETHSCYLGPSLAGKIDTFIGLAGANFGMCTCIGNITLTNPTCNSNTGFWPGEQCGESRSCLVEHCNTYPRIYASFLQRLNEVDQPRIGDYVYSAWSLDDEILGRNSLTFGNPTPYIVNSSGTKLYINLLHEQTKDLTTADQLTMVQNHTISNAYLISNVHSKQNN